MSKVTSANSTTSTLISNPMGPVDISGNEHDSNSNSSISLNSQQTAIASSQNPQNVGFGNGSVSPGTEHSPRDPVEKEALREPEKEIHNHDMSSTWRNNGRSKETYPSGGDYNRKDNGNQRRRRSIRGIFSRGGMLQPFRLLKSDLQGRPKLYHTDWHFNQLILASAVYVFFTNLLPGITFASDLYNLTGKNYGAIEVVFSTGLCGIIFAL